VFTRIKLLILSIFISVISYGQVLTSTFVDPCSKKVTIFVIPLQGGTTLTFMGKSKFFTASDVRSGAFSTWINQVYAEFSAPCPVSVLANQVTTTTVSATIAASIPSVSNIAPTPPPPAPTAAPAPAPASQSSSSSSEQSSKSSESSSSEQKTESTEESKSDSKEESKEEKKEENKKEDKKKNGNKSAMTPIIFSSDLSGVHQFQGDFNLMANLGVSQSSLAGDVSYGATAIIFSNLKQFALSTRYSKMEFSGTELCGIATYSYTAAYNAGSMIHIGAFSYVRPYKAYVFGYNAAVVATRIPFEGKKQLFGTTSVTLFAIRSMIINKKLSIAPELFLMGSPISYSFRSDDLSANGQLSYILGNSFSWAISKRFGLSANVKYMGGQMQTIGVLIGSRFNL
jgi:hypothetical protein